VSLEKKVLEAAEYTKQTNKMQIWEVQKWLELTGNALLLLTSKMPMLCT
jgi:hypothetical protein